MWFNFPPGTSEISIQQQVFRAEAFDKEGRGLFRAPEHFGPFIMQLKGFGVAREVPEDAPEDLPQVDPVRDNAISDLAASVNVLKSENEHLRASLSEVSMERDNLKVKLHEKTAEAANLQEDLDAAMNKTVNKDGNKK